MKYKSQVVKGVPMHSSSSRPRLLDQISWEALEALMCQTTEISDIDICQQIQLEAFQTVKRSHTNYDSNEPVPDIVVNKYTLYRYRRRLKRKAAKEHEDAQAGEFIEVCDLGDAIDGLLSIQLLFYCIDVLIIFNPDGSFQDSGWNQHEAPDITSPIRNEIGMRDVPIPFFANQEPGSNDTAASENGQTQLHTGLDATTEFAQPVHVTPTISNGSIIDSLASPFRSIFNFLNNK